ncbi:MAG: hypothetical protein WBV39_16560 [Rudaea sp.]
MNFRLPVLSIAAALAGCGQHGSAPSGQTAAPQKTVASKAATLVNGDFEQPAAAGQIPGWQFLQHAGPKSYDIGIDDKVTFAGHGSFRIARTQQQFYGSLVQDIATAGLVGKTVELSAMLKTSEVGAGGWKLFVNGYLPRTLEYSPGLTGTHDWQRDSVRLKITPNMHRLTIGATLLDAGTAWVDNVELHVVD